MLFSDGLWGVFSTFVFWAVRHFHLCVCGFTAQKYPCNEYALTAGAKMAKNRSVVTLLHSYENFDLCVRIKAIGFDYPARGCKIPLSVAVYRLR